jgi:hypothetical protein
MTDQVPPVGPSEVPTSGAGSEARSEPAGTGVPGVDAVLSEIERLGDLPLAEHLAAYERAHESLRRALDAHPVHEPGDPA